MKMKDLFFASLVVLAIAWLTYSPANDPNSLDNKRPRIAKLIKFARWAGLIFLVGDQPPAIPETVQTNKEPECDPTYFMGAPQESADDVKGSGEAIADHSQLLDHRAGW